VVSLEIVDKRDELPVLIDGYDYAVIGWGEQVTDAGEIRIVAIYSQAIIVNEEIMKALNFIQGHNGTARPEDLPAAAQAAEEVFDKLTKEFVGPGMPVFSLDLEAEDESGREDGHGTDEGQGHRGEEPSAAGTSEQAEG
jgi:hypothetical protein